MSITQRLANLDIPSVIMLVAILIALRFVLVRFRFPGAKAIAEIAESLALALALVFLLIRPLLVQAFFIPSESMVPTLLVNDHILVNKFVYRFREPKFGDVVVFRSPKSAGHYQADYIKRVIGVPGDEVRITAGYVQVGSIPYYHDDLRMALAPKSGDGEDCSIKLIPNKVLVDGKPVSNTHVADALRCPGSKVKVVPGVVYVNGKALNEAYTAEDTDVQYPSELTPKEWVASDKRGNKVVKIPNGRLLVMGDNRNRSDDARRWGLLDRSRMRGKAMFIFFPLSRVRWIH